MNFALAALVIMHLLGAYLASLFFSWWLDKEGRPQRPWLDFALCLICWEFVTIAVMLDRRK